MRLLKLAAFLGLLALMQISVADDNYLIVEGNILSKVHIPEIHPKGCFEEGVLCTDVYYRYEIKVKDSFHNTHETIVLAAQYEHGKIYRSSEDYLFVLEPINNEKSQKLLKADYLIKEQISKSSTYCFNEPMSEYFDKNINYDALQISCISTEDTFDDLKYSILYDVEDKVKRILEEQGSLVGINELSMDKEGNLYSEEDEVPKTCSEEDEISLNLDRIEKCDSWISNTAVLELKVRKGDSSQVIVLLNDELERLPFKDIKSEFVVETKEGVDIVRWFYEIL